MHSRVRAVILAGAALAALMPSVGAAALAAPSGPVPYRAAGQPLTWAIVPSPNARTHGTTHNSYLFGVSCPSAKFCAAVGYWSTRSTQKTLIETWNGTAWSIVPSPNGLTFSALYGVSCVSARACTAVGSSFSALPHYRTLIETWNGKAWSVVRSPGLGSRYGLLSGVSCASASACTAVGDDVTLPSGPPQTLIETWNGAKWSVVTSPDRAGKNGLSGVSCTAVDHCTAVGTYAASGNQFQTLIESWNGTKWSAAPSPNQGKTSDLNGVSCTAADNCTAVGSYFGTVYQTLVEAWNGTAWSIVPSPDAGNSQTQNTLYSVSCVAADTCTAVGYSSSGTDQTLIESWNGTAWSVVPSPNASHSDNSLNEVSCPLATTCLAVGSRNATSPGSSDRTLTELGTSSG